MASLDARLGRLEQHAGGRGPLSCGLCGLPHLHYVRGLGGPLTGDALAGWYRAVLEGRVCARERCACERCPSAAGYLATLGRRPSAALGRPA